MKRHPLSAFVFALSVAATTLQAAEPLNVSGAWVREGPPNTAVLAAYMRIGNPSPADIVIVAANSPQFERVEIHRTEIQDGIARMLRQDRLVVPAGGGVDLAPGGLHIMLIQALQPLAPGAWVEIDLQLSNGGRQQISAEVRPGTADGMDHNHHH